MNTQQTKRQVEEFLGQWLENPVVQERIAKADSFAQKLNDPKVLAGLYVSLHSLYLPSRVRNALRVAQKAATGETLTRRDGWRVANALIGAVVLIEHTRRTTADHMQAIADAKR